METPQIITVGLISVNLLCGIIMHNKNIKVNAAFSILNAAVTFALLNWGGFFN
jgi:hypothetical protein